MPYFTLLYLLYLPYLLYLLTYPFQNGFRYQVGALKTRETSRRATVSQAEAQAQAQAG